MFIDQVTAIGMIVVFFISLLIIVTTGVALLIKPHQNTGIRPQDSPRKHRRKSEQRATKVALMKIAGTAIQGPGR